jgi:formylmethanofuran dehydrogenase subunit E
MESVDFNDRYLDPPDEPERGECDGCGEEFLYDDMHKVSRQWICDECLKLEEMTDEDLS